MDESNKAIIIVTELSQEDSLRLNVLLTQNVKAIRINESNMILYALLNNKEAKIQLHPTSNDEKYLKQIKELLSARFLNSPAGFPVFMSRWTRMQQAGRQNLDALLKIGEPEAVVYAVNSLEITPEQASYAWWAMPSTEVAINLLSKPQVATSELANELAQFLMEFLPFENDSNIIIESVRLMLKHEIINQKEINLLWRKGQRKTSYLIAFLHNNFKHIPADKISHPLFDTVQQLTSNTDNKTLANLCFLLSSSGQSYLSTLRYALQHFSDQESVISIFQATQAFFRRCGDTSVLNSTPIDSQYSAEIHNLLSKITSMEKINEDLLTEVLSHSSAIGSVLRKQLEPVCKPIKLNIESLLSTENQ